MFIYRIFIWFSGFKNWISCRFWCLHVCNNICSVLIFFMTVYVLNDFNTRPWLAKTAAVISSGINEPAVTWHSYIAFLTHYWSDCRKRRDFHTELSTPRKLIWLSPSSSSDAEWDKPLQISAQPRLGRNRRWKMIQHLAGCNIWLSARRGKKMCVVEH